MRKYVPLPGEEVHGDGIWGKNMNRGKEKKK
jgi:hypothetical protein